MTISVSYSHLTQKLSILGNSLDDTVTLSRDSSGALLLNGRVLQFSSLTLTHQNTAEIQISTAGGGDRIVLDTTYGSLPRTYVNSGSGNDTVIGSSGVDTVNLGSDNDVFVWNPGGGNDVVDGQADFDILQLNGSALHEYIDFSANGDRLRFYRNIGNVTLDANNMERVEYNALQGMDNITITNLAATDVREVRLNLEGVTGSKVGDAEVDTITIHSGDAADILSVWSNSDGSLEVKGNGATTTILHAESTDRLWLSSDGGDDIIDASSFAPNAMKLTLSSGSGGDLLIGSAGNDTVIGGTGADVALLGAGNDIFLWNPGDGNDTIEGQADFDTLLVGGSSADETIELSANGERLRFSRDIGNSSLDVNGVERIEYSALDGADRIIINNLAATDVRGVYIDLDGNSRRGLGDFNTDQVVLHATEAGDNITIDYLVGFHVVVSGLPASVQIRDIDARESDEVPKDSLIIYGAGGDDTINAAPMGSYSMGLTIDGGAGNDTLTGSYSADLINGGTGDDTVTGLWGDDVVLLGSGDDTFIWNGGDKNDLVEGQADFDTLQMNDYDVHLFTAITDLSANGTRLRLLQRASTIDASGMERVEHNALVGADDITIHNLSTTDVREVHINLEGVVDSGIGDGWVDTVTIKSGEAADILAVRSVNGGVQITGNGATTTILHAESTDQLWLSSDGGDDIIDASSFAPNAMKLTLSSGSGGDLLIGSAGNDTVIGGTGRDIALLGAGDDIFVWDPGDGNDTIEGQADFDTMQVQGSHSSETINFSANGVRLRFLRDVSNVTLDVNDVERVEYSALGGVDHITINNLAATDVREVQINLEATIGSGIGDDASDTVTLHGTDADDRLQITGSVSSVKITGFPATVTILNADTDSLTLNGGNGVDVFDAHWLLPGSMKLTMNGGVGGDTLRGGQGEDLLSGEAGDDLIAGEQGNDILWGGEGRDRFRFNDLNGGTDRIMDFASDDFIQVRSSTFGGGLTAGVLISNEQFRIGSSAQSVNDRFIFNGTDLFYDADGSGNQSQVHLATFASPVSMSAANFRVV